MKERSFDEMIAYFNCRVADMDISQDCKMELLGMVTALGYKHEKTEQPEIIRCKDCRYYQDNNDGYPHINCKWNANETPDADDFCSGAERRTDEQTKD